MWGRRLLQKGLLCNAFQEGGGDVGGADIAKVGEADEDALLAFGFDDFAADAFEFALGDSDFFFTAKMVVVLLE